MLFSFISSKFRPSIMFMCQVQAYGSLEVIPSSKEIKFKCFRLLESKLEEKKNLKAEKGITDYSTLRKSLNLSLINLKLSKHISTSGADAITGGKSVAALQGLLEHSTLPIEVGVMAVPTSPFITSSFNAADVKYHFVRLIFRSSIMSHQMPCTTVVAAASYFLVPRAGDEPVHASIFLDSTSAGTVGPDIARPSQPASTELSIDTFYVSQDMDSEMLRQLCLMEMLWYGSFDRLFAKFIIGLQRQTCLGTEKDKLTDQVFMLETTCSGLRDQVLGYELFKEQTEAVQDEQVKILIDKVAELVMGMDLHLDEEFYPHFLTIIVGDLDLVAILIMRRPEEDLLMLLYFRCECPPGHEFPYSCPTGDQVVIGETSLSFSLDVVHARVQRIRGDAASHRLSLSDSMIPLIEPLSAENLVGEASTSGVLATTITTALSTTFTQTISIPPISVADYEVSGAKLPAKVLSPPKIVFEKEELETTPEHATAN
ncbi:hypothetical protein Tco_0502071 [Tanacetum coccineum]